jgi:hypothetical protein
LERVRKEAAVAYFEMIWLYLCGETEENHRNPQSL